MKDPLWGLPDPHFQAEFYADIPSKRLVAWGIDTVITLVICLILMPFTAFTALFFFPIFFAIIGFTYRTITIATKSATLGMRFVAIEFRTREGQRFDLPNAALHTGLFTLSSSMVLPQILSIFLMMTGARAQSLTDHLMGSAAVNRAAKS